MFYNRWINDRKTAQICCLSLENRGVRPLKSLIWQKSLLTTFSGRCKRTYKVMCASNIFPFRLFSKFMIVEINEFRHNAFTQFLIARISKCISMDFLVPYFTFDFLVRYFTILIVVAQVFIFTWYMY